MQGLPRPTGLLRQARGAGLAVMVATLLASAGVALPASAGNWQEEPYDYVVLDQDVRTALSEFGRNLGMPVVLTEAVKGRIKGRIMAATAGEFVDKLASGSGLTWYFDGSILHVSAHHELTTRVFEAGSLSGDAVSKRMQELGIADRRYPLRSAGRNIVASGPPAFHALVDELVQRMRSEMAVVAEASRIWVFRGGIGAEVVTLGAAGTASHDTAKQQDVREIKAAQPLKQEN